jgi:hypothetical protein
MKNILKLFFIYRKSRNKLIKIVFTKFLILRKKSDGIRFLIDYYHYEFFLIIVKERTLLIIFMNDKTYFDEKMVAIKN